MNKRVRLGRTLLVDKKFEKTLYFVRHPLAASVVLGTLFYVWCFAASMLGTYQHAQIGASLELISGISAGFNALLFVIMFEVFFVIAKDMWFRSNWFSAGLMSLPFIGYMFFVNIGSNEKVAVSTIGTAIFAGFIEEIAFRFIPVVCYKRPGVRQYSNISIAVISAVLFAIYHIPNVMGAESKLYGMISLVYALFMGFYFAGIYLKSGNILLPIGLHIANNIVASKVPDGSIMSIVSLGFSAILVVFTVGVLRKESFTEKFTSFVNSKISGLIRKKRPPKKGYYKKRHPGE